MGIFSKLFGQCGTVRFSAVTVDGEKATGKVYVETFNVDNKELENELKNALYVETGKRFRSVTVLALWKVLI